MRPIVFDVYKTWYAEGVERIYSELAIGGYTEWDKAVYAASEMNTLYVQGQDRRTKFFTVRMCMHTDNQDVRAKHSGSINSDDLHGALV